jgi:alkylation response protein AidB-like acyl-CoA dehydrogenase
MLIESSPRSSAARTSPIPLEDLARARYDARGIFVEGRRAELAALREMGARDPSLGRLYEGHFNGVLLVALYGSDAQRARAQADVDAGRMFGVWNTQSDDEPLCITREGARSRLSGAKTWCSGADRAARALVTARDAQGAVQMCLVPMDAVPVTVDASDWKPLGMEASNSYRVCFDGVVLDDDALIGVPGQYERAPFFYGGAIRFVAVHAGIVERLAHETFAFIAKGGRAGDPHQLVRAGQIQIAVHTARHWIDAGEAAWCEYDRSPNDANAERVVTTADMARLAVERAGLDVLELAVRSVGARGLLEPVPIARLVRDLTMYLRQPAPDAVMERVGKDALGAASARRISAIASSMGSSG